MSNAALDPKEEQRYAPYFPAPRRNTSEAAASQQSEAGSEAEESTIKTHLTRVMPAQLHDMEHGSSEGPPSAEEPDKKLLKTLSGALSATSEDPEDRDDKWFKVLRRTPGKGVILFVLLTLTIGLPTLAFVTAFAGMGFGEEVFSHTRQGNEVGGDMGLAAAFGPETLGGVFLCVSVFVLVVLYLLDAEVWTDVAALRMRSVILFLTGLIFVVAVIFLASDYPFGPLCLLFIGIPAVQIMTFTSIMRWSPNWLGTLFPTGFRDYLIYTSEPLALIGAITFSVWVAWVVHHRNDWSNEQKVEYAEHLGCDSNEDCLGGFLLWISPLLAACVLFFYAFFSHSFRPGRKQSELKMLAGVTGLVFLALWVASSLAGVSEGLTSAIFFFALAALVAVGITVAVMSEGGWAKLLDDMRMQGEQAIAGVDPDWIRALFVITAGPLVVLFLPISALNQSLRRCRCLWCTKVMERGSEEWDRTLTDEMHTRIVRARNWNWTSVLRKVIWLGVAYQILAVVVSKFTVLFLAWLNAAVASWSLGAIVAITVAVGIILFLLPPVPGAPIYVTAGILIPAAGEESLGTVGAVTFAVLVALGTKLIACFLQQVAIGGSLSGKVWIRQICMVNTPMIKCFRLILQERCLTLSKVGILIGGPDWPTSVLCGILRIPLVQTQIGTLPAIVLIAPCVLTGAFYYYDGQNPDRSFGTLAVIAGMIGAGVQTGSLVVATYYVDKMLRERKAEVDAIPDDEEVKAADERSKAIAAQRTEAVHWQRISLPGYGCMRRVLVLSALLMIAACYLVTVLPAHCYRSFELTDTIDDDLSGKAFTIDGSAGLTKPLGNVALLFFFLSMAGVAFFGFQTNHVVKADEIEEDVMMTDDCSTQKPQPVPVTRLVERSSLTLA